MGVGASVRGVARRRSRHGAPGTAPDHTVRAAWQFVGGDGCACDEQRGRTYAVRAISLSPGTNRCRTEVATHLITFTVANRLGADVDDIPIFAAPTGSGVRPSTLSAGTVRPDGCQSASLGALRPMAFLPSLTCAGAYRRRGSRCVFSLGGAFAATHGQPPPARVGRSCWRVLRAHTLPARAIVRRTDRGARRYPTSLVFQVAVGRRHHSGFLRGSDAERAPGACRPTGGGSAVLTMYDESVELRLF